MSRIDFLYLDEEDTIAAGVNDRKKTIEICREVFGLLGSGDYLMGGTDHCSHGECIIFPRESPFPRMPLHAPDRRFYAMPAYLGGRFHMVGNKWYGSNVENIKKGLPRSILTLMLNDVETGAPLCLMSANLLSAARTGAIPALAAQWLRPEPCRKLAVLACGPINESCVLHLLQSKAELEKISLYDLRSSAAERLAARIRQEADLEVEIAESMPEALADAELITAAASRLKALEIDPKWLRSDACLLLSGQATGPVELFTESELIFDHIPLHQSYMAGAAQAETMADYYGQYIAGPVYALINSGEIKPLLQHPSLSDVMASHYQLKKGSRTIFYAVGMPVFDVAMGTEIYRYAKAKGIGQSLRLWEQPAQLDGGSSRSSLHETRAEGI